MPPHLRAPVWHILVILPLSRQRQFLGSILHRNLQDNQGYTETISKNKQIEAVLPEGPGSIPSTYMAAYTHL